MSDQHKYLLLPDIQTGMVLSHELLDKQGHVLLPAGTTLNELIISSLHAHDIHQVSVLMGEVSEADTENEMALNKIRKTQRLTSIFRHSPYDEPRSILASYIQAYREGEQHE